MRYRSRFPIALLPLLFLACPALLPAQDSAAIVTASLDPERGDSLTEDIVATALEGALTDAGLLVLPERRSISAPEAGEPGRPTLPDEQRITLILGEEDLPEAEVVAAAFYLQEGDALVIQFVLYDPVVDTVLGGVLTRTRSGLTIFTAVQEAVADFEPSIERYVAGGYQYEPPPGIVERITIRGPREGSSVFLIGERVGEVAGGELVVPYTQFEVGNTLQVELRREGYHDVVESFLLEDSQVDLALPPLRPETRFEGRLRWSLGLTRGIGFAARYYLTPDTLFLGVEQHRSLQGSSAATRDVRNLDYNIRVGRYLVFPYDSFFRASLAAGLGVVLTDVQGQRQRAYTDSYVIVGDPTLELSLGRTRIFGRLDLRYALGLGYNLLGRSWIRTPFGLPPVSIGVGYTW